MRTSICPTITVADTEQFQVNMKRIVQFATRVHIDLSDGIFSPSTLIPINDIWWPGGVRADLHVMYQRPQEHAAALIALQPQLIIVHAEAEGDFLEFAAELHHHGIEAGIALLPDTKVDTIEMALEHIDYVLIFAGKLGFYGGQADLSLLSKVKELRLLKPTLEIGWDGGINDRNTPHLVGAGVDVLNVGGYIAHAKNPEAAYATLVTLAG